MTRKYVHGIIWLLERLLTTTTTMLNIKRNGRVYPEETPEVLQTQVKPEVAYETHVYSRASSTLSVMGEKRELRELLEVGSGKKRRQTFQMILMVVVPILGLLSITTVTLISTLQTFVKANKAQDQLKAMLQVMLHIELGEFKCRVRIIPSSSSTPLLMRKHTREGVWPRPTSVTLYRMHYY